MSSVRFYTNSKPRRDEDQEHRDDIRQSVEDYRRKIRFKQVKFSIIVLAWQSAILVLRLLYVVDCGDFISLCSQYVVDRVQRPDGVPVLQEAGGPGGGAGAHGADHHLHHRVHLHLLRLAVSASLHGRLRQDRGGAEQRDGLPGVPVLCHPQGPHLPRSHRDQAPVQPPRHDGGCPCHRQLPHQELDIQKNGQTLCRVFSAPCRCWEEFPPFTF